MKIAVYLGSVTDPLSAKTATGILEWTDAIAYQISEGPFVLPNIPVIKSLHEAPDIDAVLIGTTSATGDIDPSWEAVCKEAIAFNKPVYCGMHQKLKEHKWFKGNEHLAIDFRHRPVDWKKDKGDSREGLKIAFAANDCSCGKKYGALTLTKLFTQAGKKAVFVPTGQTGRLIQIFNSKGQNDFGIPIDAVPVDFVSGAIAHMTPSDKDAIYLVEGQGAITHPSYSGNTMSLITGSHADFLVYNFDPTRAKARGSNVPIADPLYDLELTLRAAAITNLDVKLAAIVVHTHNMDPADIEDEVWNASDMLVHLKKVLPHTVIHFPTHMISTTDYERGMAMLSDSLLGYIEGRK